MTSNQLSNKISDKVATFAGSWKFFGAFLGGVTFWMLANHFLNFDGQNIALNLMISVITALLATIVLMRENRHAKRDRDSRREHMEMTRKIKELLERDQR